MDHIESMNGPQSSPFVTREARHFDDVNVIRLTRFPTSLCHCKAPFDSLILLDMYCSIIELQGCLVLIILPPLKKEDR